MDRSQKLINPFVPETKEYACVCIYIVITDITKSYNICDLNDNPFSHKLSFWKTEQYFE